MTYKIVQMCLRGLTFVMMIVALYYNTESENLTCFDNFLMCGVYGAYTIVTLGLLLEVGLQLDADRFVEIIFLASGVVLNLLCAILAFIQFYSGGKYKKEAINKGLLSMLAGVVYVVDIGIMFK